MPAMDKGVAVMVAATWSSLRRLGFVKSTTARGQNICEKIGEQRRSAATVREVAGEVAAAMASGCDVDWAATGRTAWLERFDAVVAL
ncbi:hypothetical protein M0R45_031961 [Rubus argutus]|uniref:Uncharacterized protein n=1 Tax=Rubus argutus TaxID=59490 RepID=A0AAW1WJ66_RUBAR